MQWTDLPGWDQDKHSQAWPALLKSCQRLAATDAPWGLICSSATEIDNPTDSVTRQFFETHFVPHRLRGVRGKRRGLITGYYEPLLWGSLEQTDRFRYPIYRRPDDLLHIELGELFPDLKNRRVRGRLVGNKVVPYHDRATIEGDIGPLKGHELLWVDNAEDLFFLHIQGSGRVRLPDGRIVGVGYADQNGYAYTSIGRVLADQGELELEEVSLFTIRDWLRTNSDRSVELLSQNQSYVFFSLREETQQGPIGSFQVPLSAERSIAVDPQTVPLGVPIWLDTSLPGDSKTPYRHLVFAQDTGGAIKGHIRADLFWGMGPRAELMAGTMKQPGRLYVLLPKGETDDN
ncbi:MAG: MltA domain-containing protein [Gammaproteobacteria bacterium]|nr:MltA domain-containing protein [Gammaproteobacteria bacterium]